MIDDHITAELANQLGIKPIIKQSPPNLSNVYRHFSKTYMKPKKIETFANSMSSQPNPKIIRYDLNLCKQY